MNNTPPTPPTTIPADPNAAPALPPETAATVAAHNALESRWQELSRTYSMPWIIGLLAVGFALVFSVSWHTVKKQPGTSDTVVPVFPDKPVVKTEPVFTAPTPPDPTSDNSKIGGISNGWQWRVGDKEIWRAGSTAPYRSPEGELWTGVWFARLTHKPTVVAVWQPDLRVWTEVKH